MRSLEKIRHRNKKSPNLRHERPIVAQRALVRSFIPRKPDMPGARSGRPAPTLDEFVFVDLIRTRFGGHAPEILTGIGDDAAVIRASGSAPWVFTTDLLAENIHFSLTSTSLTDLGYKAGAANLSDVAAMGARPLYLLVNVAIPPRLTPKGVSHLYQGLSAVCRPHRVRIVGGDTSASQEGLFIAITAIGRVAGPRAVLRQGARPGDILYVSGFIGESLAGLTLLGGGGHPASETRLSSRHRSRLLRCHRRPEPRVALGVELGRHRLATSMIDLSDGLSADLPHVCEASGVGAQIEANSLPLSPSLKVFAKATAQSPVDMALRGGEDYELLFTSAASDHKKIHALGHRLRVRITEIGRIMPSSFGRRLHLGSGVLRPLQVTGYRHFSAPGRTS